MQKDNYWGGLRMKKPLTETQKLLSNKIFNVIGNKYTDHDCIMALANNLNKFKRKDRR